MNSFITETVNILSLMLESLSRAWPFLVISVPISVLVNLSGAGEKIRHLIGKNVWVSIIAATFFGALSPLCSCTVIPVIFSLLVAGVPLAPVMSFWIASPSMDPEIFFLSVTTLGWNLAIWRMAATFALSLGSGIVTQLLVKGGYFNNGYLRENPSLKIQGFGDIISGFRNRFVSRKAALVTVAASNCACATKPVQSCCSNTASNPVDADKTTASIATESCGCTTQSDVNQGTGSCCGTDQKQNFTKKLVHKTFESLLFVGKFMIIAYFIEALIKLYVPSSVIVGFLGTEGVLSIFNAAILGIPVYTNNFAALGLIGGLLPKGLAPGAALAFLISGPVTTIAAMSAVFGIATRRVFILYLAIALVGAIFFGYLYAIIQGV